MKDWGALAVLGTALLLLVWLSTTALYRAETWDQAKEVLVIVLPVLAFVLGLALGGWRRP